MTYRVKPGYYKIVKILNRIIGFEFDSHNLVNIFRPFKLAIQIYIYIYIYVYMIEKKNWFNKDINKLCIQSLILFYQIK